MLGTIFLVRHGQFESLTGHLTDEGRDDAEQARQTLAAKGAGTHALLLCSDLPRATETAEVIAQDTESRVVPSRHIAEGGHRPQGILSLDQFLSEALGSAGIASANVTNPLVVITHAPLLATAMRGSTAPIDKIAHGQVIKYEPGSWRNSEYREVYARILQGRIVRPD